MRSAHSLLPEFEAGDPIEHYRGWRSTHPALACPTKVTRVFRGLWGNQTFAAPLLGVDVTTPDKPRGVVQAAYTPIRYRLDLTPSQKRKHPCDRWNVFVEQASLGGSKPFEYPRTHKTLWCFLLMYTFEGPTDRRRDDFWVDPLDPIWDFPDRDDAEIGSTFYCSHRPLPVTVAYVKMSLVPGRRARRFQDAPQILMDMMQPLIPRHEERPKPRVFTAPPAEPKKHKLRYIHAP